MIGPKKYCILGFIFFMLSFFCILLFSSSIRGAGEPWHSSVKVLRVQGAAKIMKSGTDEWIDCEKGMTIDNGDRIKTAEGEFVEISFMREKAKVTIIKVEENSDIVIKKTPDPISIELLNGEVMSLIEKLKPKSTFEIKTPAGLCGVRGTGWRTRMEAGQRMTVDVFEKEVFLKGVESSGALMEEELVVRAGWRAVVERFERPLLLERLTARDYAEWKSWKRDLVKRLGIATAKDRVDRVSHLGKKEIERAIKSREARKEVKDLERIDRERIPAGGRTIRR